MRIVHMSTVHSIKDIRIFRKMCCSLADEGHDVHYIATSKVKSALSRERGVYLHTIPRPGNRIKRALFSLRKILCLSSELKADIYHFHDPEFLPWMAAFQSRVGSPVVYDAHEDIRLSVQDKQWIPRISRTLVSCLVGFMEDRFSDKLAAVISATPAIARRFSHLRNAVTVQNFPIQDELWLGERKVDEIVPGRFIYVGGITERRGIRNIIEAIHKTSKQSHLVLAGQWESRSLRDELRQLPGWSRVIELGFISRDELAQQLRTSVAGLVLYKALPNHINAQPNKLFEYMSAGLPVIASDFPLWRDIISPPSCGIVVNQSNTKSIATALTRLSNVELSVGMGINGRNMVLKEYCWATEYAKLRDVYREIVSERMF